ncbi:MAG: hypothetical protein GX767_00415 [Firmicutes bacterium]|nr:hypothetical protein [Bacillota bacterium]
MYLFVLVLNKTEKLNKILEKFVDIGIRGATVLDSKGMGETIMECESPVVGGLRKLIFNQCRSQNNTIFSVVESLDKADAAVKEVEKIIGSLDEPGTGIYFVISLEKVKGVS